jgi:hypothetical protein
MPAQTSSHSSITPSPAKPVATYARALASVSDEVLRDPNNTKLSLAFEELLPLAAWTLLEFSAQSASSPPTEERNEPPSH